MHTQKEARDGKFDLRAVTEILDKFGRGSACGIFSDDGKRVLETQDVEILEHLKESSKNEGKKDD